MKGKSRRERFDDVISSVGIAVMECHSLRDELQEWLDNMPENLQGGEKASQLEEAIANLEDIIDHLEDAETVEVEFPGMYP